MSAPAFLNKPKHKDNVIATSRGWVVEKTGELLVSVKNLDQRIAEHLGLSTFAFEPVSVSLVAPVVEFSDTTLPVVFQVPHIGDEVQFAALPHTGEAALIAPMSADASIDSLLDALDTTKAEVDVTSITEAVKEDEAPVVAEKKKRGGYRPRKPKATE